MKKQFAVGDYSWQMVSEVIDMVNANCKVDNEPLIPMKMLQNEGEYGWFIECLNADDEPRLSKHLAYIFGLEE
jgi:hypothetical protein